MACVHTHSLESKYHDLAKVETSPVAQKCSSRLTHIQVAFRLKGDQSQSSKRSSKSVIADYHLVNHRKQTQWILVLMTRVC